MFRKNVIYLQFDVNSNNPHIKNILYEKKNLHIKQEDFFKVYVF